MRDDPLDRRLKCLVSGGVITVMVGVDEDINPAGGALCQTVEKHLGGLRELAIDDHHAIGRDESSHRSTASSEDADVPAQRRELRRG